MGQMRKGKTGALRGPRAVCPRSSQVQAHGTPGRSSLGSGHPGRWGSQGREDSIPPRPEADLVLIWMKVRVQHLKSGGQPQSDSGGVPGFRLQEEVGRCSSRGTECPGVSGWGRHLLSWRSSREQGRCLTFPVSSAAAHRQPVLSRCLCPLMR